MTKRPDYRHVYIGEMSKNIGKDSERDGVVSGFVIAIAAIVLVAFGMIAVEVKIQIDKKQAEIERAFHG